MRKKTIVALTAVLVTVMLAPAGAQATTPRVTQGDAQAIFQALPTGGWAVILHGGMIEGAPADFLPGSSARIAPNPPWNGSHFCSLDWHAVTLADIDGNLPGESLTSEEIRNYLLQDDVVFTLDGAPLDTSRSAIKRFLNPGRFGLVDAYAFQEGLVIAPQDLSVGPHSLKADILHPGVEPDIGDPITFVIDAAGQGSCL